MVDWLQALNVVICYQPTLPRSDLLSDHECLQMFAIELADFTVKCLVPEFDGAGLM